jgi:hypothetical protein
MMLLLCIFLFTMNPVRIACGMGEFGTGMNTSVYRTFCIFPIYNELGF